MYGCSLYSKYLLYFLPLLIVLTATIAVNDQRKGKTCPHKLFKEKNNAVVPVIFVYTLSENQCKKGFSDYIRISIEQAVLTQVDTSIIFASNYNLCNNTAQSVSTWDKRIIQVDTDLIASNRSKEFVTLYDNIFVQSYMPQLWGSAALRFFIIEDIMAYYNYTSIIHVECDNLLYGNLGSYAPLLKSAYPGLAATPMTKRKDAITASVFW